MSILDRLRQAAKKTFDEQVIERFGLSFPNVEYSHLLLKGFSLDPTEAEKLENKILTNPNDKETRLILISFYMGKNYTSDFARARRIAHVEWLAANYPADPCSTAPPTIVDPDSDKEYPNLEETWLKHKDQHWDNPNVLTNVAEFFLHNDKQTSEICLLRAKELKPANLEIRRQLAQLYSLWDGHEADALLAYEDVYKRTLFFMSEYALSNLPMAAVKAGKYRKARVYAGKLLQATHKQTKKFNYCSDVHQAHTAIGLAELTDGNTKAAVKHLRLAVTEIENHRPGPFRIELDLAKKLIDLGEKDAVIEYLDCFDRMLGPRDEWAYELRYEIEAGRKVNEEDLKERDQRHAAFLEHQLKVLASKRSKNFDEDLKWAISRAQSSIAIYGKGSDDCESTDCSHLHPVQLERYKTHLAKLEALQAQEQERHKTN